MNFKKKADVVVDKAKVSEYIQPNYPDFDKEDLCVLVFPLSNGKWLGKLALKGNTRHYANIAGPLGMFPGDASFTAEFEHNARLKGQKLLDAARQHYDNLSRKPFIIE